MWKYTPLNPVCAIYPVEKVEDEMSGGRNKGLDVGEGRQWRDLLTIKQVD